VIIRRIRRLLGMDRSELAWRIRSSGRIAVDRARATFSPFEWDRAQLGASLAALPELHAVRAAIEANRWHDAHAAFCHYFSDAPQRFVIAPSCREPVVSRVKEHFPDSTAHSAAAAARLLDGRNDLLGYEGLNFSTTERKVDWHRDPVNGRRAPLAFWAAVPFLDQSCGDHKIIWELNRHQHWLTLGRAFWLTGNRRCRAHVLDELGSWLEENPPLTGINWASMLELAFRSLSWIWALSFFVDADEPGSDAEPWTIGVLLALDRQLDHIERNLSYYFSPNTHLLGEALALYVTARALPVFRASPRREALGRAILCAQIDRQIERDGGHCERSTCYHRYTLDFYLLALAAARIGQPDLSALPRLENAVARLGAAARLLADDNGRLPHFGDDDGGSATPIVVRAGDDVSGSLSVASVLLDRVDLRVGPLTEESYWLLAHPMFAGGLDSARQRTATPSTASGALPQTGYYVSRSPFGDHLVVDAGPHGFQNGGHAHADALSLTLTDEGVPLLIDPGTGSYTTQPLVRDRLRSSAAHNTLTLDGRSQSIPSGPFHWLNQANAIAHQWQVGDGFDYFEATHDAYLPVVHRRHVLMRPGDLLVVADRVVGTGVHRLDVHWHVDPRWRTEVSGQRATFTLVRDPAVNLELAAPGGALELFVADEETGLGWHSPAYGRIEPSATLRLSATTELPAWLVSVFRLKRGSQLLAVERQSDTGRSGSASSLSLLIDRSDSVDRVEFGIGHVVFDRRLKSGRRKVAG
jgi:Heparinase II/III-like protein/Heparinase II/III N-terminus